MRADAFMPCPSPSPCGVTDAFTTHESLIYNFCCRRQPVRRWFSTPVAASRCVQLCLGERLQHFSGTLCPVASLLTSPARSCHLPGICLPGRLPQQRCVAICIASLLRVWRGSRNSNLAILMNESFCQCVYSL